MFKVGGVSDHMWDVPGVVKYLAQHQGKVLNLTVGPEAVDLAVIKLYDLLDCFEFAEVNIYTSNPFEKHDTYNIVYVENFYWFEYNTLVDSSLHTWNQSKIFLCLFARPTAGRIGLASYLDSYYQQQSHIHFSARTDADYLEQFELNKLLTYRTESIDEAGRLLNKLPLLLGDPGRYSETNGYDYSDALTELYADILVDVVVESHVLGHTFYVTEKTVRPILLKKPFLVFASKNYLGYLHQMGFLTFNEFWDESYDGFEARDRFDKLLTVIDSIASKTPEELDIMYCSMKYILDHNYSLVTSGKFNKQLKEIT